MNNYLDQVRAKLRAKREQMNQALTGHSETIVVDAQGTAPRKLTFTLFTGKSFSLKERVFFAKRLSFLVQAGIPLIECLHVMRTQTKGAGKISVVDAVIGDIASGQYLASSISKHKNFFDDFSINMIRIGETSGILTQNLNYLADELEKKAALRRKIQGALIYPAFITIVTLLVTGMITVFIFPKIMPIFQSLHVDLPITTIIMIAISDYLRDWGILTIVILVALVLLFLALRGHYEKVRYQSDRVSLYLPLAGSITKNYNLANFCRTLGLMLKSGVPVTAAMATTADATEHRLYREAYREVTQRIDEGETLAQGLARRPDLFPDLLVHMVTVGEKTGNLSGTLTYLSELYELEVEELTKNLSSAIEPAIMIVMGLIVGLIAVSVITPIYAITQHLSPH